MIVPGSANALLLRSARGYQINQSLRFRASNSATITRTPSSSGNRRTFTWSGWIKRGNLSNFNYFFGSGATSQTSGAFSIVFQNTAQIQVSIWDGGAAAKTTNAVYRDPSAWYHIVVAVDTTNATAADRVRLYVNGSEVTSFASAVNPSLNLDTQMFTSGAEMRFGSQRDSAGVPSFYFDGQFAEFNLINGVALTPASFGQIDTATGAWVPRRYTGVYGAQDQYLPFNDATSTTTISQDRSGNGNNWTSSGISVTAGATFDQMTDTPTNNYATLNPLANLPSSGGTGTITEANLRATATGSTSGTGVVRPSTAALSSFNAYAEFTFVATSGTSYSVIGVRTSGTSLYGAEFCYLSIANSSASATITTQAGVVQSSLGFVALNDVIGVAFEPSGAVTFYKNNVIIGTRQTFTATGTLELFVEPRVGDAGASLASIIANFGQRPFAYTPPTGFVALCTANLPTPTIQNGASSFQATTYTGNGAARSITNSGGFQPDLVWIKDRTNANDHVLFDAVRGATVGLRSNLSNAEATDAQSLTAFNSNGFSLGTGGSTFTTNFNGSSFVAWQWREGAAYGFDIVTYTGNGANRTIAHGLNAVPHMMIGKRRSGAAANWTVYHRNANVSPATGCLLLNGTNSFITGSFWNSTDPTSSVFSLGTDSNLNANGETNVMYLWTSIPGFSLFGSYTGNGSADGPFVWCGFRPRFVMVKRVDAAENWFILDAARAPFNMIDSFLLPASSAAETTGSTDLRADFTANGFKVRGTSTGINASGGTYIFAAFAEHPFKFANAR